MANPKGQTEVKLERIPQTFKLRKQGKSFREIAAIQGSTISTVQRDLLERKDELYLLTAQEKAAYRADVHSRLTSMMEKLQSRLETGDLKTTDVALKILKSIREMLGLDAPVEIRQAITLEQFGSWASGIGDWVVRMADEGVSGQGLIDSWLAERGGQGQPAIEGSCREAEE